MGFLFSEPSASSPTHGCMLGPCTAVTVVLGGWWYTRGVVGCTQGGIYQGAYREVYTGKLYPGIYREVYTGRLYPGHTPLYIHLREAIPRVYTTVIHLRVYYAHHGTGCTYLRVYYAHHGTGL